jgi:four helix bundle protein
MRTAKTFQDLEVWQKAHQLVLQIYETSKHFPKEEMFGLTSQIRRASVSIPANIAEGFKRQGTKDKVRFYNIAQSSLEEVRYYLILIQDLDLSNTEKQTQLLEEISKMLTSYIRKIKSDQ